MAQLPFVFLCHCCVIYLNPGCNNLASMFCWMNAIANVVRDSDAALSCYLEDARCFEMTRVSFPLVPVHKPSAHPWWRQKWHVGLFKGTLSDLFLLSNCSEKPPNTSHLVANCIHLLYTWFCLRETFTLSVGLTDLPYWFFFGCFFSPSQEMRWLTWAQLVRMSVRDRQTDGQTRRWWGK